MGKIKKMVSSNGVVTSVANQNIVENPQNKDSFDWKRLSLKVFAECNVVINNGTQNESHLILPEGLELNIEDVEIKSLFFVEDGVDYYYIAGY